MTIRMERLGAKDIRPELLSGFERRQDVKRCWRKDAEGHFVLKDIAYISHWDGTKKAEIVQELRACAEGDGAVVVAYEGDELAGFGALRPGLFGMTAQYIDMHFLHVSHGARNRGIGRAIFGELGRIAREMGAEKLYISAHSAEETVAFYQKMGCVDALEQNQALAMEEPCDRQMECPLDAQTIAEMDRIMEMRVSYL